MKNVFISMISFIILKTTLRFPGLTACETDWALSLCYSVWQTQICVCIVWIGQKVLICWNWALISMNVCVWIAGSMLLSMPVPLSLSAFLWLNYCQYKGSLVVRAFSAPSVTGANWGITHPYQQDSKSATMSQHAQGLVSPYMISECVRSTALQ